MKKVVLNLVVAVVLLIAVIAVSSCKRCATCTFDDQISGKDTSEFCGSGNSYKDQLDQHEDNGWKCVED